MTNQILQRLKTDLEAQHLIFEFIEHKPITSVEEGLKFLGIKPEEGVSTLLFKSKDVYFIIIRRDDHKLSFKKIKKIMGVTDISLASPSEVEDRLGAKIGYVCLYNPQYQTLIDEKVFENEYVYGGTGDPCYDLKIKPTDLLTLTKGQKADMSGEELHYEHI